MTRDNLAHGRPDHTRFRDSKSANVQTFQGLRKRVMLGQTEMSQRANKRSPPLGTLSGKFEEAPNGAPNGGLVLRPFDSRPSLPGPISLSWAG